MTIEPEKLEPAADEVERVRAALEGVALRLAGSPPEVRAEFFYDEAARAAILAMDRRASPETLLVGYVDRLSNPSRISPTEDIELEMPVYASPPAPAVAVWQANMENAWAALRMIREAVETFGPLSSLESEEAVLLRGPEPVHEAEAIVEAILRLKSQQGIVVSVDRANAILNFAEGGLGSYGWPTPLWMAVQTFKNDLRAMLAAAPEPPATRTTTEDR